MFSAKICESAGKVLLSVLELWSLELAAPALRPVLL